VFKQNRVPVLELPAITATTIQAIQDASAEKKKHLTYSEAEKLPSIHQMCRFEIEYFLNRIFTQCEDMARVLVPDPALIKNKVSRPTDKAPRKAIDEFNPLDDL
jgi:hypothetical protein